MENTAAVTCQEERQQVFLADSIVLTTKQVTILFSSKI